MSDLAIVLVVTAIIILVSTTMPINDLLVGIGGGMIIAGILIYIHEKNKYNHE